MDEIREQHKQFIYAVFGLTATIYLFLISIPAIKDWLSSLEAFGLSWTVFAAVVVFLYEKYGWRIKNPRMDFGGHWNFTEKHLNDLNFHICDAKGHMIIKQDVRSISIELGVTDILPREAAEKKIDAKSDYDQIKWWSISCDLDKGGNICCALDHTYPPGKEDVRYGIEIITVTKRDKRERPIEMSSTVYHCIGSRAPHQITVKYKRQKPASLKQRIKKRWRNLFTRKSRR